MIRTVNTDRLPPGCLAFLAEVVGFASLSERGLKRVGEQIARIEANEDMSLIGLGSHVLNLNTTEWALLVDALEANCRAFGDVNRWEQAFAFFAHTRTWDRFTTVEEYEAMNGDISELCHSALNSIYCQFGKGHGGFCGHALASGRMVWWERGN